LLRRGRISGLLANGVHVSDLETMPIPVVRYGLRKDKFDAGIYVRHNPDDYRQIDFILFDGNGLDMPTSKLKKIDRQYFGADLQVYYDMPLLGGTILRGEYVEDSQRGVDKWNKAIGEAGHAFQLRLPSRKCARQALPPRRLPEARDQRRPG
ncbi:MAG: hypothetical protein HGA24_05265, partial [Candidatus Aminicenantes bacterium]|nr:hypothetical protein [Candidatus Aminicenantes bacterium]